MHRMTLMPALVIAALLISGCATGEYEASDEHCSAWYIAKRKLSDDKISLQEQCLRGYYSAVVEPPPTR